MLGAFRAGADAVYLGGQRFGARAYAQNFSEEEILQSLEDAHLWGKKIYLTANILTRQQEMEETLAFVERLAEAGLDGVIVQDIGLLKALHERCPNLPLHASTQMSVTSAEAVRMLRQFGVTRVVPARELTLPEVKALREDGQIAVETFIHGAMCYAYSGRCLFSSFLGGRSGNRGRCAGTCRLPFTILDAEGRDSSAPSHGKTTEQYPLSMKDMCTLPMLPELLEAGIDSFKIEGRMKRPEYAAGVTALYRKYIDLYEELTERGCPEKWRVDPQDLERLGTLYIRSARSEGYYHGTGSGRGGTATSLVTMDSPGYSGTDEKLLEEIRERYLAQGTSGMAGTSPEDTYRRRIGMSAVLEPGSEAALYVWTMDDRGPQASASATGDIVQTAQKRPLEEADVRRRLGRTGDTDFAVADMQVDLGVNAFMPVSRLQELRRSALEDLRQEILRAYKEEETDRRGKETARREEILRQEEEKKQAASTETNVPEAQEAGRKDVSTAGSQAKAEQLLAVQVLTEAQMRAAAAAGADVLILEEMLPEAAVTEAAATIYTALPYIYRAGERDRVRKMILETQRRGYRGIMARTLEELMLAQEMKEEGSFSGEILADSSLYVWNRESAGAVGAVCDRIVLPEEAGNRALADVERVLAPAQRIRLVYGRVPLMFSAGCIRRTAGSCAAGRPERGAEDFWYLRDRKNARFPVRMHCRTDRNLCSNVIYNSVPISLHDYLADPGLAGAGMLLCAMTVETPEETEEIVRWYSGRIHGGSRPDSGGRFHGETGRQAPAAPAAQLVTGYTTGHYRQGAQ